MEQQALDAITAMAYLITFLAAGLAIGYCYGLKSQKAQCAAAREQLQTQLNAEQQALARACEKNHLLRCQLNELEQGLNNLQNVAQKCAELDQALGNLKQAHATDRAAFAAHTEQLATYEQLLRDTAKRWNPDHDLQRKLKPQDILDHRACLKELADLLSNKATQEKAA